MNRSTRIKGPAPSFSSPDRGRQLFKQCKGSSSLSCLPTQASIEKAENVGKKLVSLLEKVPKNLHNELLGVLKGVSPEETNKILNYCDFPSSNGTAFNSSNDGGLRAMISKNTYQSSDSVSNNSTFSNPSPHLNLKNVFVDDDKSPSINPTDSHSNGKALKSPGRESSINKALRKERSNSEGNEKHHSFGPYFEGRHLGPVGIPFQPASSSAVLQNRRTQDWSAQPSQDLINLEQRRNSRSDNSKHDISKSI